MSNKTFFNLGLVLGLTACAGPADTKDENTTYYDADQSGLEDSSEDDAGDDDDAGSDADPLEEADCEQDSVFCVALVVPEDYAGNPRNLFVGLYDSLPPLGPPTVFLFDEDAPDFTPGEAIEMYLQDDVPDSGEYFLFSVLYDQGGGEWMPEPGIDYVATSDAPYVFDGQGLDVGEVNFSLYAGK